MTKLEHTIRLAQMAHGYWTRTLKPGYMPVRMWVEPTNACNLKCTMCPQSFDMDFIRGFMEFSLFRKIIDETKTFVYDMNLHHSGESLLHPDIIEMIRYAKQAGIYTRLHTNATLLYEDKAKGILEAGLDFLSFSFDGFDGKKAYEEIRRGANYEKTLGNILNFLHFKKAQGSKRPFTVLEGINFSGEPENTESRQDFKLLFETLPLDKCVLKAPHNWGGMYDPEGTPLHPERYCACTFPWYALVVFWNGNVSPCPQDFSNTLNLGNTEESSLRDIWHGASLTTIRKKMKEKTYHDLNPCATCDLLYRDSFLGIPTSHMKNFVRETLGK